MKLHRNAGDDEGKRGRRSPSDSERMRTSTTIELDAGTYEEVLGQTVGSEDFDAEATVSLAQHNTSRKHRSQSRLKDVEEVLVRTADDGAFGSKGLDFQTAGLLEKRLLYTADMNGDVFQPLEEDLAEGGLNERAIPGRYDVVDVLGEGASGQVFAAEDNNLNRQVAVKFLHPEDAADGDKMARFVKEAQVTGSLEHPNILPVFDFDLTDGGLAYFTMRKASGTTLFDAIKRSEADGRAASAIATHNDRVAIMLKVCDAIGYAHDRGIIHQDIKPSNIMLGEHAAVVLVDWGTALTTEDRAQDKVALMGTPAYMAPEQARREYVDERSDVYCLGATFFQLLTLRYPTWADDPDTFWELKREGIIRPPTEDERRMIPPALLDIALKAMAVDPQDRYATVDAMRRDLLNFQEGLSVSAHEDSLGELLLRWYRLNRKAVVVAACALVLIAGLGVFYAIEKAKERSTWHHLASEGFDFEDVYKLERDWVGTGIPDWRSDRAHEIPFEDRSEWSLSEGRLIIDADHERNDCVNIAFKRQLPENFRVHWSATPLDGPHNLNCFVGNRDRTDAYVFHVGGYGMSDAVTLTKGPDLRLIERRKLRRPLETGRTYRFGLERRDSRISLSIDGQVVLAYDDPDMAIGPEQNSFGFEVGINRVAFDDVSIEYLPLAQKVDPIVVADSFYARRHYAEALEHYRRIRQLYPETAMAVRAAYREGRCLARLDRLDEAVATFSLFAASHGTHPLANQARYDMAALALGREDWQSLEASLEELAANQPSAALSRASMLLVEDYLEHRYHLGSVELLASPDAVTMLVEALDRLESWQRHFGEAAGTITFNTTAYSRIANDLTQVGAHQVVIDRFTDNPGRVFSALQRMDRHEEALARYADNDRLMANWLARSGRHEELIARYPDDPRVLDALLALHRFDQARQRFPDELDRIQRQELIHQRRFEEALALTQPGTAAHRDLLIRLGRATRERDGQLWLDMELDIIEGHPDLALERALERSGEEGMLIAHYPMALSRLVLDALIAGDEAAARRWLDELEQMPVFESHDPFHRVLLPVLVEAFEHDPQASLTAAAPGLRTRYALRFGGKVTWALDLLLADEPDRGIRSDDKLVPLLMGVRAELAGDRDAAVAAYRSHLQLIPGEHWRPAPTFSRWRLQQLGAPTETP